MRRLCTLSLALLLASGPSWAQTPPADAPKDEQPAPPADAPKDEQPAPPADAPKDEQPAPPAGGQSPASPAQPGPGQPPASGVVPPTLKKDSQPTYPKDALDKRIEAVVVLDIDITPEGFVDSASVVKVEAKNEDGSDIDATGLGFDDAATVAALGLEFNPATDSGKPIPVRVTYTYRFKLPAKPQPTPTPQPPPPPPPPQPAKQPVANFTGVMVERGTRSFVPAATVTVYRGEGESAEGFEATTDDQGKFVFYDLEPGEWNVRATIDGYIPFKTRETITVGEAIDVKYYIERGSYNPYDVTIEAERPKKEVNRRSLRKADIERIPGTLGDPVLVIENLPGVARAFGGQIIVRGSGPQDTGIFVDGSTVPLIFHFGALKSVLPAAIIEGVDFFPGNYSVRFGRRTGGIYDLHVKRLDPDRVHGSIDVSILDTSIYVEAPIGDKAAIAVGGRRSYIDYVLETVIPDDAGFNLTTAPRYYDFQVLGNYRPNRKHEIRWLALASDDLFEILFDDAADTVGPGAQGNDVSATTNFQRVTTDYRYTPSKDFQNRTKFSAGRDVIDFRAFGLFRLQFDVWNLELRNDSNITINDNLKLNVGLDLTSGYFDGQVNAPPIQREGEAGDEFNPDDLIFAQVDGFLFANAVYAEAEMKFGQFSMVPGLRLDYFGQVGQFTVDPRLVARYDFKPGPAGSFAIKGGAAVVHQEPEIPDLSEEFGNPDLDAFKAYQYSIGGEWKPFEFLSADLTFFYKDIQGLPTTSDRVIERDGMMVPEVLRNQGVGRVYGLEVFIDHKFANNFRGWLSYTLNRAERRDRPGANYRLFDFDQTHIFALVGNYTLPRNWQVGLRWRLVTGNPFTPAIGGVLIDQIDEYQKISGPINSGRLPMFQSLDLRVDKTWVFDLWKFSAYLSLINAYNRENVESIDYSFDFTEETFVFGLPIIPIIGVKGEW